MEHRTQRSRRRRRRALRAWLRVRRNARKVIGRWQWEPPAWVARLATRCAAARAALNLHPLTTLASLTLLVSAVLGTHYMLRRAATHPVARTVKVTLTAPGARDVAHAGKPRPLLLTFASSAAPLAKIGHAVERGMALTPPLSGSWRWRTDRRLVFTPHQDWPIGQKMRVVIAPGSLASGVLVDERELAFETAPFIARVGQLRFHEDPRQPTDRRLVATLTFSHPVSVTSLRRRVSLALGRVGERERRDLRLSLRYDEHRLHAYVKSEPLAIPSRDLPAALDIAAGVRAYAGGPATPQVVAARAVVPGIYSRLKIASLHSTVVDRTKHAPQHVLIVQTSAAVDGKVLRENLRVYLLPRLHPDDAKKAKAARAPPHRWTRAASIGEDILALGRRVKLTALESTAVAGQHNDGLLHVFRYHAPIGRWLYAVVARDTPSRSGYKLGQTFATTLTVPEVPARLEILSKGAILRLSGARRLAVYARNVAAVQLKLWRLLPRQLHHHVLANSYQSFQNATAGDLASLAEVFKTTQPLAGDSKRGKTLAFDVGRYLRRGVSRPRGVFVVEARAMKRERGKLTPTYTYQRRAIVVTDLGLLVKRARDGSRDVFVQSLSRGGPVSGATVELLGRNGLAVASARTDGRGRAHLPKLTDAQPIERRPVVWVVRYGNDFSFMPYDSRRDRRLDYSRFATGGRYGASDPRSLVGYLFSDRKLYRPGEQLHVGVLVKRRDFGGDLAKLPLELALSDRSGRVLVTRKLQLDAAGFAEVSYRLARTAASGTYSADLYIARDGKARSELGSTTLRVRDFAADRMKIRARLSARAGDGWLSPRALSANVTVRTLYGTPAAKRRVKAHYVLRPAYATFSQHAGYTFHERRERQVALHRSLGEVVTDAKGKARIPFDLSQLAPGLYRLSFVAEAFAASGGRSVVGQDQALVSSLDMLVGFSARGGTLDMIPRASKRAVHVIAIGRRGLRERADGLTLERIERRHVSVLTKQRDGTYVYQSVPREVLVTRRTVDIGADGRLLTLDTRKPGDFRLRLRNAEGEVLLAVDYKVAGEANVARSLERSAELGLHLARGDVPAGSSLRLQIKGPYAGAGLIAIERERVLAFRWFRARKGTTVASIRVPAGLEGNAYVTVTMLRDRRSNKVFSSPLSYAVKSFRISRAKRELAIKLDVPKKVEPGKQLEVRYSANRRGRVLLYAVDEGILRVANYQNPDPIAHFFRKQALEVRTEQTLDLLLPEARQLMRAPGGGGGFDSPAAGASRRNLNPFQRRRRAPVAFWSGMMDVGPKARVWRLALPDHFDGTLRIIAVAASKGALGASIKRSVSRGDLVLEPQAPLFVTPADTFELGVLVSNQTKGTGKRARVTLRFSPSKHLELLGPATRHVIVPEGGDEVVRLRVRVRDQLGAAHVTIDASLGESKRRARIDTSVRPATPRVTTVRAGVVRDGKVKVAVPRTLYAAFRRQQAGISALPLGLAPALVGFLRDFPHGCTEQIISQGWPALVMLRRRAAAGAAARTLAFAATHEARDPRASVGLLLGRLARRQNSAGGFGLWAASPQTDRFASVYALHFLVEAKRAGVAVPTQMLSKGLRWARGELARRSSTTLAEERLRAYAVYVLARAGRVVGAETAAIHRRLERYHARTYVRDLASAYLAATYQLLRQRDLAADLIDKAVDFGRTAKADYATFYDALIHDAQLLELLSRHFPRRAAKVSAAAIEALVGALRRGRYNTLSAAYTVLALDSYSRAAVARGAGKATFAVREIDGQGREKALALPAALLPLSSFSSSTRALSFEARGGFEGFYSLLQSGYDRGAPSEVIRRGLEVAREYVDAKGRPLQLARLRLGQDVFVRIRLRSTDKSVHPRVALVDMLPGGFEVPRRIGAPSSASSRVASLRPDYIDTREDRVVVYATARPEARELVYRLKATSAGRFATPPLKAESMYDRSLVARSLAGRIVIMRKTHE